MIPHRPGSLLPLPFSGKGVVVMISILAESPPRPARLPPLRSMTQTGRDAPSSSHLVTSHAQDATGEQHLDTKPAHLVTRNPRNGTICLLLSQSSSKATGV